jgi:hypothetical protein
LQNGTGRGLQSRNDKSCKRSGLNVTYGHASYVMLYENCVQADYGPCLLLTMDISTACNIWRPPLHVCYKFNFPGRCRLTARRV